MGGGMGFGGGGASLLVAGGGGESPRPPPPPPWGGTDAGPAAEGRGGEEEGGSLYGKAAMERLRASQKAFVASKGGREEDGPAQAQAQAPSGPGPIAPPTGGSPRPGTNFLPTSGGVLAGDEALAFMEEGDDEREGFADPSSGGGRWGGLLFFSRYYYSRSCPFSRVPSLFQFRAPFQLPWIYQLWRWPQKLLC